MKQFKYQALKSLFLMATITSFLGNGGCYYDDEANLYPEIGGCDITNVTYTITISAIMSNNCNACHSGSTPESNVKTDNYNDLKIIVDNGKLSGCVNHDSGFSAMPKDRPKLSDCDLSKINTWIIDGASNN